MGRRVCTLLAVILIGCSTPALEEQSWVEIDTRHFRIVSALSDDDTVQLARDLESFHAAVLFILGKPVPQPPVRTRVYAFDELGFERTFARGNKWSYFVPSLLGPAILLRNGGGWRIDSTHEVRRQYTEYLFRQREGLDAPLWLDAGLSQLASGSFVQDEGVEIGVPPLGHKATLENEMWIPSKRFLVRDDFPVQRGVFDAQAWAFMHHLFFGEPAGSPTLTLVRNFRQKVRRGVPPTVAVQEVLGRSSGALDRRLNRYFRQEHFETLVVRGSGEGVSADIVPRPLAADEVLAELGWIAMDVDQIDAAAEYFEQAVAVNPRNARAEAGFGAVEQTYARWESAAAHFNRAIGMAPGSAATQLDLAGFYLARAEATRDERQRRRLLELARTHANRCLEINPEFAAAYALIAAIHLLPGEDPQAGMRAIFRAEELMPGSLELAMLRSWLLYTLDKPGSARSVARRVLARRPADTTVKNANALLEVTKRR